MRIAIIIIFHLGKLWKAKFFILCDIIFPVRLQGKFEIDHGFVMSPQLISLRRFFRLQADLGEQKFPERNLRQQDTASNYVFATPSVTYKWPHSILQKKCSADWRTKEPFHSSHKNQFLNAPNCKSYFDFIGKTSKNYEMRVPEGLVQ